MEFKSKDEKRLEQRLEELHKDVSKKQKFEDAVVSLNSLLRDHYASASPSLRKLYYGVVCRVATVLKTRYTSPGFWAAGLALFRLAQSLVSDPAEKAHLLSCISEAQQVVHQESDPPQPSSSPNQGYLFEGHLTVDREPPQPQWLVQSNLMTAALAAGSSSVPGRPESGTDDSNNSESAVNLLQSLIDNLDNVFPPGIMDDVRAAPRVPPASKRVVANLPVITITEEVLKKLGEEAECAICKENLVVNDKMQELPCKHTFHPPCLKPWLDEHNSCPICRHELQTDDHAYESWKEREREAEEDRKGAANAVRGGEYIYLTELLAKDGFLVISVPYNVTFDHVQAAAQVYERFNACLDTILASGLPNANLSPAQLAQLPVFSVGHSNGALLQVLAGSYFSDKVPKANAIIAYNNRPATEAVPYFEQLGPLVNQMVPIVEASPVSSMARTASGDAWKALVDAAGAMLPDNQETLSSLTKFVDQLPSVLNEVTQGISEFKPTPSENRVFFKSSYNVKHTLLVKFNFDAIDETYTLEETLKPRVESIGGTLEKVEISGNHITPCIQEPKWQVGNVYTPADAVAQSLKTLSLNDVRVLSRTISDWFRGFED
ncbi:PREDICTED: E3 ubiquitin-ligase [Prunus dulcis]|uniref:RING-type E3 ubiquitin transferase n=1 Tax=Prunus dulcis TaxID=3755 RepID=A0A5E4EAB7_PRUDU|nr:PREDICTED: E3 ubiquitin-ligase [Prunus dulcis]